MKTYFYDERGLIPKQTHRAHAEAISHVIDYANYLQNIFYNHDIELKLSPEKNADEGLGFECTLKCEGLFSVYFSGNRYDNSIYCIEKTTDRCGGFKTVDNAFKELKDGIYFAILDKYGTRHTPPRQRPKIQLIQFNDDTCGFVDKLARGVKQRTEGAAKIEIFNSDSLPTPEPRKSLWDVFGAPGF